MKVYVFLNILAHIDLYKSPTYIYIYIFFFFFFFFIIIIFLYFNTVMLIFYKDSFLL